MMSRVFLSRQKIEFKGKIENMKVEDGSREMNLRILEIKNK